MKLILSQIDKKSLAPVILFFALLFLFGLFSFQDYGLAGDAYEERRTCLVNYKYLVPSVSDIQTDTVNFSEIPDLNEYFDRYYGVALQMPTIVVEHLFDFNLTYNQIFQMRHLYTFLLYFIGCIFFYLLARCFTDSRLIALAGTAVFVLSPQILSNSLYNIKDIPFLAIFIVNLYFGIRFLRSPRSVHLLLLAMVSAICTNTRIIGAIVIFACLFIYLIKGQSEESPLKRFGKCVLCGLVCLLCYILITPVTWSSPVQAVIETLKTFSSFNVYQFNNYFMGTILDGADLPWYYLPVWIVLTTPVLFSVLSIIGLIASAVHPVKQRHIDRVDWEKLFLFLTAAIPLGYVMLMTPVLYNGWRHFYFVYAVIAIFALFGFQALLTLAKKKSFAVYIPFGLYMASLVLWIGRNHPSEFVYFNYPARSYASQNMDKDYWNVGAASAVNYLLKTSEAPSFSVIFYPHSWYSAGIFTPEEQSRVLSTSRYFPQSADYYLYTYQQDPATETFYGFYYFEEIYSSNASGIKYNAVFQRSFDLTRQSNLKLLPGKQTLFYGTDDITWEMKEIESGKLRLTGTITSPILSDRLYITNLNSLCSVENVTVTDTAGQTNTAATQWVESDVNSGTWIFYDACQISKISFDLAYPDANGSYPIIVQVLTPSEENPGECYSRGLAGFSTGENWASAGNAGDYSLATSWHADTQYEGLEATVELSAPATISGFSLETGGKDWDCPQDLILSVSSDGEVWTEIDYQSDNNIDFLFSPVNCQYIRLTIGPHSEEVTSNWTVAEVLVYTDVKGIDNENN